MKESIFVFFFGYFICLNKAKSLQFLTEESGERNQESSTYGDCLPRRCTYYQETQMLHGAGIFTYIKTPKMAQM